MPARMWKVGLSALAAALIAVVPAGASQPEAPATTITTQARLLPNGELLTLVLEQPVAQAGCGQVTFSGTIKKQNIFSITLWTWRAVAKVSYCNYKVTGVPSFTSQPIDSCCSWDYKGQIGRQVSGVGTAAVQLYIKGQFQACIGVVISVCDSDYPWFTARINGNGVLVNYDWGY